MSAGASRTRQRVIGLVKLLLVAGLLYWVFSGVQWRDVWRVRRGDAVISEQTGAIVGAWRSETQVVRFRADVEAPAAAPPAREIAVGPQADGTVHEVTPGFVTYLRNLDALLFAAGALCYFLSVMIASTRWWRLMRYNALDVTWYEALRFTWIGVFFNNVVPGQTGGDVVKSLYIMKHCHGGRVPALVSVIVDRILGLGSLALLGAIVVLFQLERFTELAIGIWAVLAVVGLIGVVAFSKRIRRLIRLDQLLKALPAFLSGPLQRVDQAIHFYRRHKGGIFAWLLIGMFNHVASVSSVLLIGTALGVGLPPLEYFVLIPIITIISALPLGPNGWGVGEAAYRYLFSNYGAVYLEGVVSQPAVVMGTRGVALSVLFRIHLTLWSLLGGVLLLFTKNRVTRAEFDEELAREEEEARHAGAT